MVRRFTLGCIVRHRVAGVVVPRHAVVVLLAPVYTPPSLVRYVPAAVENAGIKLMVGSDLHAAITRQVCARSGREAQERNGGEGSGHLLQPRKPRSSNMSPPAHQKKSALAMA